ncbi:GntR family transcriptional regulator [Sneathiella sp.]|jgi:GntR family transcriptional regulator|uniref:GntR family transcriptional regulator n=1 Tax=Sneathiella sp. TaxID=1964365 RepID=UPI0039E68BF4
MNTVDGPYTSRVSLYLKVANILRSRIIKGLWRNGERLPTISSLCQEFQVGRITVRQALHLLADEGLIISSRGRGTYVSEEALSKSGRNGPTVELDQLDQLKHVIKVLEITGPAPLPRAMIRENEVFPDYYCVRKLRFYQDIPYCLMDIYVERRQFEAIPRSDISLIPIAKLISTHGPETLGHARQTLTVGSADYETSQHLECAMAAPVAEIHREFLNQSGYVVSSGHYLYRGDLFLMETEHVGDPANDLPSGWLPDVRID